MRIFAAENLRFYQQGSSADTQAGSKARPKGVVDVQQVDIPAPLYNCLSCVGWLAYSLYARPYLFKGMGRELSS